MRVWSENRVNAYYSVQKPFDDDGGHWCRGTDVAVLNQRVYKIKLLAAALTGYKFLYTE